jgi:hypothetical protein
MPVFDFEEFVSQRLNSFYNSPVKPGQSKEKQKEVCRRGEAMWLTLSPLRAGPLS